MERVYIDPTLFWLSLSSAAATYASYRVGLRYRKRTRSGYNAPGLFLGQQLLLFSGLVLFSILLFKILKDIL